MLNKIRSKKILKDIFVNIKKRIRLNILKYNKKFLNKLNINKKDFEEFKLLDELNQKLDLDIKDIDTARLNLDTNKFDDEILEYFYKINFNELKELDLKIKRISDLKILEKIKFENLEKLLLNDNNLTDINILAKLNFKKLKALYLKSNSITDINLLEKVNFKGLKELYLNSNKISDIKVLERVNFGKLEILYLN